MKHASLVLLLAAVACRDAAPARDTAVAAPAATRARIFATIGDTGSTIEGVATHGGALYVADWKDGGVYRVDIRSAAVQRVATLGTAPHTSILGVGTDSAGNFYAALPDSGLVLRIAAARLGAADFNAAKDVSRFATGVKGANAVTFDAQGHLWISGGNSDVLYHVGPKGGAGTVFAGKYSPISTDTTMPVRVYTVNGVAFDSKGSVYTLNTGTGEISKLEVLPGYKAGKITTFVRSAELIGADGVVSDANDNLWVVCNFLSRLARVSSTGEITVIYTDHAARAATRSDTSAANVLRFPAELKIVGGTAYLSNLNFPIGANTGQTQKGATIAAVELPAAR